jgi:integrase/recombinase XerC
MEIGPRVPGAARLHLADGIPLLRPEEQVFTAMLEGWRHQQLARNLALATVAARERAARAFTVHADAFPWLWTAAMLNEWLGDLRAVRGLRRSTLRGSQKSIRMLRLYLTDPAYGWTGGCETRFGTHPVQVVHEWNTAVHVQQAEGDPVKRAFSTIRTSGCCASSGSGTSCPGCAQGRAATDHPASADLRPTRVHPGHSRASSYPVGPAS